MKLRVGSGKGTLKRGEKATAHSNTINIRKTNLKCFNSSQIRNLHKCYICFDLYFFQYHPYFIDGTERSLQWFRNEGQDLELGEGTEKLRVYCGGGRGWPNPFDKILRRITIYVAWQSKNILQNFFSD